MSRSDEDLRVKFVVESTLKFSTDCSLCVRRVELTLLADLEDNSPDSSSVSSGCEYGEGDRSSISTSFNLLEPGTWTDLREKLIRNALVPLLDELDLGR